MIQEGESIVGPPPGPVEQPSPSASEEKSPVTDHIADVDIDSKSQVSSEGKSVHFIVSRSSRNAMSTLIHQEEIPNVCAQILRSVIGGQCQLP